MRTRPISVAALLFATVLLTGCGGNELRAGTRLDAGQTAWFEVAGNDTDVRVTNHGPGSIEIEWSAPGGTAYVKTPTSLGAGGTDRMKVHGTGMLRATAGGETFVGVRARRAESIRVRGPLDPGEQD